jgi:hypothetical protein
MRTSILAGNRVSFAGVLYSLGAILVYNVASQLDMLWLGLSTVPIAIYYIIRWPHERSSFNGPHPWLFHIFGGLALIIWVIFIFGTEVTSRVFPIWVQDHVRTELIDGQKNARPQVAWDIDGRQAKAENASVWFAAVVDKRVRGTQIEQTLAKFLTPLSNFLQRWAFSLTILLTIVCGTGLFISGVVINRRSAKKRAS